jgi:hypothetical protein
MSRQPKDEPKLSPVAKSSLQESLASALAEEGDKRKNVTVSLKIAGGLPSEEFHLDFRASGDGTMQCEMECGLSKRRGKSQAKSLKSKESAQLLRKVLDSGLLNLEQQRPRFLPDTLIGILEITDGESVHRTYFAADPEQAKMQNQSLRPELEKIINEIYGMGAQLTGLRSVKP